MRTHLLVVTLAAVAVSGCSFLKTGGGDSGGDGGSGGGGGGGGATGGGAAAAPASYSGKVTGSVLYRERIVLPADAQVVVQLVDATITNAAASVIAEKKLPTGGKAPPYSFELSYDPKKINEQHRYVVRADITVRGAKRFTTVTPYPVITQGAPASFEIVTQAVRQ